MARPGLNQPLQIVFSHSIGGLLSYHCPLFHMLFKGRLLLVVRLHLLLLKPQKDVTICSNTYLILSDFKSHAPKI